MRGIKREERVQIRNAEQEEDGGDEPKHASSDRARDDSSTGDDTVDAKNKRALIIIKKEHERSKLNPLRVFRLFSDVARGVEAS